MNRKTLTVILLGFMAFSCFAYILVFAIKIHSLSKVPGEESRSYQDHIVVIGDEFDTQFHEDFFNGIKFTAAENDAIAEYLGQDSFYSASSLEDWIDYARFVDADGIIIVSRKNGLFMDKVMNFHDHEIPVVVAGECSPGGNQISHVTSSKYEMGKLAAEKIRKGGWKKPVAFIRGDLDTDEPYRIVSGAERNLRGMKIRMHMLVSGDVMDDEVRSSLMNLGETNSADIILCFSSEETNLVAQTIIDQNLTEKMGVMGFYGDEKTKEYLSKGIVVAMISSDPWKMGSICVDELYSWKRRGFSNKYRQINVYLSEGGSR